MLPMALQMYERSCYRTADRGGQGVTTRVMLGTLKDGGRRCGSQ
jgi:hypothetical protein